MKIYINGEYFDKADAKISVFDHGLLYGDGVFEGIRLYNGCIFKLDEHLERLHSSAKALLIDLPLPLEEIAEALVETCRLNNLTDGYIRLIITRGEGSLGLSIRSCKKPQLIIIADKIALYSEDVYKNGMELITVGTRRNSPAATPPSIKSLNYLNNILAKIEAELAGYSEAIMLNDQGLISECTGDNIFIIKKGVFFSPYSADGALKGITRETVKEITDKMGYPFEVRKLSRYDLWDADECFLTGTAAEVVPVIKIDGRPIGSGVPGPITADVMGHFKDIASKQGRFL